MAAPDTAPTTACRIYTVNGVHYVPHYLYLGIYIGPGGKQFSHKTLRDSAAATPGTADLWPRRWAVEQGLQEPAA